MYFLSGVRLAIQYNNPPKIAVNPLPVVARNIGLCTPPAATKNGATIYYLL
ncbi:MAG: hypothetical protein UE790_01805 [Lachnospira sp.]|nr:hypothetical protein [Lachnospira sp.]